MDWSALTEEYLDAHPALDEGLVRVLERVRDGGPGALSSGLEAAEASTAKDDCVLYLLHAIGSALSDHTLERRELDEIRVVQRALRVEEGDLLVRHRSAVADLLGREAARIFEDDGIDRSEEVHKARLQEVIGVGYDDFIALLEPEINRLLDALRQRLRNSNPEEWLGSEVGAIRARLNALSLAQYVQWLRHGGSARAGYIYLMVNSSMPGMVKVGRTGSPPSQRAAQLTGASGVPTPFEVLFELPVTDQVAAEAHVHRVLEDRGARVANNREFFAVRPDEAIEVMLEAQNALL